MKRNKKSIRALLICLLTACFLVFVSGCYYYEEVPAESDGTETSSSAPQSDETGATTSGYVSDDTSSNGGGGTGDSTSKEGTGGGKSTSSTPAPTGGSKGDLKLVTNGVANCTIVIAEKASEKVKSAAEDLQHHIYLMTGATPPIGLDNKERVDGNYILVGPSKYTEKINIKTPKGYPNNEKVILKRHNNYLALLGNDDGNYTGTQFAVNMFLEELGCGWFAPDNDLWTVIPKLKNISVGTLNRTITPKFTTRTNNIYSYYKDFAMRWYLGGEPVMTGHGLPLLVPKTEIKNHPEWFSLINGKRTADATWWQYCYSNQEFAKEIGRKVIEYFDKNPYAVSYPICANDGWNTDFCECSDCAKFPSYSDLLLEFANRVAREVAKKYPNRTVHILSYHATYDVPKQSRKAEPNVEIMFCRETFMTVPITAGYFKPGYNTITRNTYTMSWKDNFEQYIAKTGVKKISIWEWYCLAVEREVWKDIPWVQGSVAIENQNYWKSKGASYVFYDHGPLPTYRESGASFPLRWPLWYVASKGAWASSLTGDQILADACNKLFGKAGSAMLKYYQALAKASAECKADSIAWIPPGPDQMYTSKHVAAIDNTVKAAKALRSELSANERARLDNQISYWENAKKHF